ncbi:hypothetical protein TRVA0_026S01904 [Trichomonascus vanleenenianus]|uniref:uncharacterized protein n=1 Tax=Trichomonascus vanleenenianus TaxID=2268995 RepID=UPI003ECB871B
MADNEIEQAKEAPESILPRLPRDIYGLSLDEVAILALYPMTMVLGQLVSIFNPGPSYFSNKRNVFNVLFVRQAWLWTTMAFAVHSAYAASREHGRLRFAVLRQEALRYVLATVWWLLFAQWFFGMPLMDRIFVLTGGYCDGVDGIEAGTPMSSAACRSQGGIWTGGYDPSGHSFLLPHSSLFLWFEILPTLRSIARPLPFAIKTVLSLIALWWWMLLMTSIYFHSFTEKMAGLIWGYIEILVVYVYARKSEPGRALFGHT